MGKRSLRILGLHGSIDEHTVNALRELFARHGEVQTCFAMQGAGKQVMVTMKKDEDVEPALEALNGYRFNGSSLTVVRDKDVKSNKKGKGGTAGTSSSVDKFGPATGGWGGVQPTPSTTAHSGLSSSASASTSRPPPASSSSSALAPAPRPLPATNAGDQVDGITDGMSKLYQTKDTWELSLEDSDYDDGFRPAKKDNKPPPIQKAEWLEAFDLVKSFAHYGGAVLSVDVESWDRDQDYIIEIGLAYCSWQKGNAVPPRVKAEHIVIKEHEDKRNGVYSPDAKDRFAFGKSKTLTEFESQVYLRMLIKKLSEGLNGSKQPLIFLFHNAAAEKNYFQLMNLDVLDNAPERIPAALLRPTPADFRNEKWSGNVILDTQRLWKAFLIGDPKEKEAPLALGKICRELGVATKYLHNAGNDALYTLKVFTKLAELESEKRKRQREAMQSGGATI